MQSHVNAIAHMWAYAQDCTFSIIGELMSEVITNDPYCQESCQLCFSQMSGIFPILDNTDHLSTIPPYEFSYGEELHLISVFQ